MYYRKVGGIHWLAIGRLRIAFCFKRKPKIDTVINEFVDNYPKALEYLREH